jgi:methylated-DNA-[protein]-cysteine S-methyltransferase
MNSYTKFTTPVGELTLIANSTHLLAVLWEKDSAKRVKMDRGDLDNNHAILKKTAKQLQEYFDGKRKEFDLPIKFEGTDFQKKAWAALTKIPYGKTASYKDQAKKIGVEKAVRAVGAANGKNPLSIVVPCHRVIGTNGKLTGFAGGLKNKDYLLKLESH